MVIGARLDTNDHDATGAAMQVAGILRGKGQHVATVAPADTVERAVAVLREHGVGALVVSADGETIDGIVSERDVVRALADTSGSLLSALVESIMTRDVVTCEPTGRIEELMSLMTERRIRHLPVEADGKLAGIISIGDVVKWRLAELEEEARRLEEYIHHGR